jgi:hypothetical protein
MKRGEQNDWKEKSGRIILPDLRVGLSVAGCPFRSLQRVDLDLSGLVNARLDVGGEIAGPARPFFGRLRVAHAVFFTLEFGDPIASIAFFINGLQDNTFEFQSFFSLDSAFEIIACHGIFLLILAKIYAARWASGCGQSFIDVPKANIFCVLQPKSSKLFFPAGFCQAESEHAFFGERFIFGRHPGCPSFFVCITS